MKAIFLAFVLVLQQSGQVLDDPKKEARAQDLMREIRCVACENEPISQSSAEIASDMRDKVRDLVAGGASDAEVRQWFVDRYGEFVVFRPTSEGISGKLLWGLPFVLLIGGGLMLLLNRRQTPQRAIEAVAPDHIPDHGDETDL